MLTESMLLLTTIPLNPLLQEGPKHASAGTAAASSPTASMIDDLVSQQLQGSSMADTEQYQKQQAFLAAVDKALLKMKLDVLDR